MREASGDVYAVAGVGRGVLLHRLRWVGGVDANEDHELGPESPGRVVPLRR